MHVSMHAWSSEGRETGAPDLPGLGSFETGQPVIADCSPIGAAATSDAPVGAELYVVARDAYVCLFVPTLPPGGDHA